jgi:para-nitrobenzyl esterase
MKKIYLTSYMLFWALAGLFAQDTAGGCDGIRYIQEPFSEVSVSTVVFGENFDASGQLQTLQMDIYQPIGDTVAQRPVILWAFGGGFVGGSKEDMEETCREFARRGFVTAAFDYRLYPLFQGIPDSLGTMDMIVKAMHDMKAAVRFLRQDAATDNLYRIDPERVLVGGVSAGAITALHAAYLDEDDDIPTYFMDIIEDNGGLEGNSGDATNLTYDSDIQFVISLSGALYKKEWIDAAEAPLLSIHGTADEIVPYAHGFLSIEFGVVFNFNSVDGSGALHPVMDDLEMNNLHIAVPGGMHESTYTDPANEPYLNDFAISGGLMMYEYLCPDIPVVITSTKELLAETTISVYPNPVETDFNLRLGAVEGPYDVALYDLLGRQIAQWNNLVGDQNLQIAGIPTGYYFLQVRGENWQGAQQLLVR